MFPDLESEWEGYPSIIDGIERPYVHVLGGQVGTVNLLVTGKEGAPSGYGISAHALLYWVVDEFEYSVTEHGLPSVAYDGTTYIKRARRSELLQTYDNVVLRANFPGVRHFAFLGGEDCVEIVAHGELTVVALPSKTDRDEWIQQVCDGVRKTFRA